jgi:aryl-alcohol dehydrogenase-like predicted oxidoreductase
VDLITAQKSLERCYELGFKQFDTAPNYGMGFAEFCLGKVLGDKNDCLINTKMGNSPFFGKSFSINNLKKSVEDSLLRLKCDNINILFLHNPRNEIEDYDEIIALMETLKTEGKIRYSGLSKGKGVDYKTIVDLNHFDFIQDDINLLYLKPIFSDFENNYKLMARSPLASGLLSGKISKRTVFQKDDHRSGWIKGERLASLLKRIQCLEKLSDLPLPTLARRFLLNYSSIDSVIFGVKNETHVDDIFQDLSSSKLDHNIIDQLFDLHSNDFGLINEKHLGY